MSVPMKKNDYIFSNMDNMDSRDITLIKLLTNVSCNSM